MKKALLFALAGLLAAVAPALAHSPAPANVNFSSERGVPFGLALDGRLLTRGLARQLHVGQLRPGLHWADFTLPAAYGGVVRFQSRVWLEPGVETSFVLIARPGRPLALRQVNAVALYDRDRYDRDDEDCDRDNDRYERRSDDQNGYGNNRYPDNGSNQNNGNDGYRAVPNPNPYANNSNNPNSYGNASGDAGNYAGPAASRPRPSLDAEALSQAMQQRPFDDSRLRLAKEALNQNSIPATDLKRLLRSLRLEASRVELAKFAYPHVADPQNFYQVYEAFDFDTSVREVQQAVGAGR